MLDQTIASLKVKIGANLEGLKAGIAQTQSLLTNAGTSMKGLGKSLSTNLTLPVTALGGAIVKTAGDFEASMNNVRALTGATGDEFESLEAQAKELGATTKFSASQAADAMGFLAMAGFEADDILASMSDTLNLAAAANLDLGRSADIVSNVLSGYGMETEQLGWAVDILTKTFTSSNTSLVQLGEAFKFAAPIAKGAGLEFTQTAAAIGQMGNAGIQATMAGTSLRGGLVRLLNPTKDVRDALESLGLSVEDLRTADGNLRPLTEIVRTLNDAGIDAGTTYKLFGKNAGAGFDALLQQGAPALEKLVEKLEAAGGTAETIAKVQMEGLNGSLAELRSAAEGLAIAIGQSGILEWMTDFVRAATAITSKLIQVNPAIFKWGTVIAGVAAAIGPLLMVLGSLSNGLGVLIGILPKLAPLFGPVGLAIAGVVTAGALLIAHWDEIVSWIRETFPNLLPELSALWRDTVGTISASWEYLKDAASYIFNLISGNIEDEVKGISAVIKTVFDGIRWFWDTWGQHIITVVSEILSVLASVFRTGLQMVTDALSFWGNIFTGDWSGAWDDILSVVWNFSTLISDVFQSGLNILSSFFDVWKKPFVQAWEGVSEVVSDVWRTGLENIINALDVFNNIFTGNWSNAWTGFLNIVDNITGLISRTFETAIGTITGLLPDFIKDILGIETATEEAFVAVEDQVEQTAESVAGSLDVMGESLIDTDDKAKKAKEGVQEFTDTAGELPQPVYDAGDALSDLGDEFGNTGDDADEASKKIANAVREMNEGIQGMVRLHRLELTKLGEYQNDWVELTDGQLGAIRKSFDDKIDEIIAKHQTLENTVTKPDAPREFSSMWGRYVGEVNNFFRDLGMEIPDVLKGIIDEVNFASDQINAGLEQIGKGGLGKVFSGLAGMISGADSGLKGIIDTITGGGGVISAIGDIAKSFGPVGAAIGGAIDLAESLGIDLDGVARKVGDAVKGLLGLRKESKQDKLENKIIDRAEELRSDGFLDRNLVSKLFSEFQGVLNQYFDISTFEGLAGMLSDNGIQTNVERDRIGDLVQRIFEDRIAYQEERNLGNERFSATAAISRYGVGNDLMAELRTAGGTVQSIIPRLQRMIDEYFDSLDASIDADGESGMPDTPGTPDKNDNAGSDADEVRDGQSSGGSDEPATGAHIELKEPLQVDLNEQQGSLELDEDVTFTGDLTTEVPDEFAGRMAALMGELSMSIKEPKGAFSSVSDAITTATSGLMMLVEPAQALESIRASDTLAQIRTSALEAVQSLQATSEQVSMLTESVSAMLQTLEVASESISSASERVSDSVASAVSDLYRIVEHGASAARSVAGDASTSLSLLTELMGALSNAASNAASALSEAIASVSAHIENVGTIDVSNAFVSEDGELSGFDIGIIQNVPNLHDLEADISGLADISAHLDNVDAVEYEIMATAQAEMDAREASGHSSGTRMPPMSEQERIIKLFLDDREIAEAMLPAMVNTLNDLRIDA